MTLVIVKVGSYDYDDYDDDENVNENVDANYDLVKVGGHMIMMIMKRLMTIMMTIIMKMLMQIMTWSRWVVGLAGRDRPSAVSYNPQV